MSKIIWFAFLITTSCAHTQPERAKVLSGLISIYDQKCSVEPNSRELINCGLNRNEDKSPGHILNLKFPANFFSSSPACIFQTFSIKKPGYIANKFDVSITFISSSEVRIKFSDMKPELLKGDIVLSFICET